jgi:hypothetical protein
MRRYGLLGAALVLTLAGPAERVTHANETGATVVYAWNQILQNTIPGAGGPAAPRFYAMTHIAMFDAVNTIERGYHPYVVDLQAAGGSPTAAAAQAAHDVLVALNPNAASAYDALLASQIGAGPSGYVAQGAAIGARVARYVLEWRQNDGWLVASFPPYAEPPLPGRWQPTPPASGPAVFTHVMNAEPMAVLSPTQFLPPPPPALTSDRYAADLNEVQMLGKSDSGARGPEQTILARLWSGVAANGIGSATPVFAVWNNIARDVATTRGLSLLDAARLFALVNVAIHDGVHTTQTSKFVYGVWRPVTAIRQADDDLNAATHGDATWLPLITTPSYPAYAGNLVVIAASAARVLQLEVGTDDVPVAVTWRQTGLPDAVRQFENFAAAANEVFVARIYAGVHYRFDQIAGQNVGNAVAEYVVANFMRPAPNSGH